MLEIRQALVNHESGRKLGVKVKIHYSDYERVHLEQRDYFYAPLPLTPFGIAVVLPSYGRNWVKVIHPYKILIFLNCLKFKK